MPTSETHKPTICLDFDGVIHSYVSGWKDAVTIPDNPVDGTKEAIRELREKYGVIICSTRCETQEGKEAIAKWLTLHELEVDGISGLKPPAIIYVDDRAIQFNGDWQRTLKAIKEFKHWLTK